MDHGAPNIPFRGAVAVAGVAYYAAIGNMNSINSSSITSSGGDGSLVASHASPVVGGSEGQGMPEVGGRGDEGMPEGLGSAHARAAADAASRVEEIIPPAGSWR